MDTNFIQAPNSAPVVYSLKYIMDKLTLTNVDDFHKLIKLLYDNSLMPAEIKNLIDVGNMDLTEFLQYQHTEHESIPVRWYRFSMHYYTERLAWNDYGLIFRPYGKSQVIFTNEEFVDTKINSIKDVIDVYRRDGKW